MIEPEKLTSRIAVLMLALLVAASASCRAPLPPPVAKPPAKPPKPRPVAMKIEGQTIVTGTDSHPEVSGYQGAVATGGRESMKAGMKMLVQGGNAYDAAAAVLLALAVEQPTKFCFAGEVPIMAYNSAEDCIEVFCGQGAAPELATLEYFKSIGGIPAPTSGSGANAPVPGAIHAICTLLEYYGTMSFSQVASPALELLEEGKEPWHADMARTLGILIDADVIVRGRGGTREEGILAAMDEFYGYEGAVAKALVRWCEDNGVLIRHDDLAAHETLIEDPVESDYRGHTVYKCDTWTQGPVLLQTLNILEGFDLSSMGHNAPPYMHTVTEAMKLALADRDNYFGDPLYVDVPLDDLLSKEYSKLRRTLIDPEHASLEIRPGDPVNMRAVLPLVERSPGPEVQQDDTTTCIVADRWGNIVVATPSGWGGVLAGDTGIWLSTRLTSFNTWQGHPNSIEPYKRPRITLTPTLVFKDDKPYMAISVAGGDWQDQVALNIFLNVVEFDMPPGEAITKMRFGTGHLIGSFAQPKPLLGNLQISESTPDSVVKELEALGHDVTTYKWGYWSPSMMLFEPDGLIRAAGDPMAQRNSGAF